MTHLLAYLIIRNSIGIWNVSSYRDLDGLRSDCQSIISNDLNATAIVHVGFWRPDTELFEPFCATNKGRVLLTATAKLSLPPAFVTEAQPCGYVKDLPIFLALKGWGYSIEEEPVEKGYSENYNESLFNSNYKSFSKQRDWLENIRNYNYDLYLICDRFSILSEADYQKRESQLPSSLRDQLGLYRFHALYGQSLSCNNILEGLLFTPPWVLSMSLNRLDLPIRAIHCFENIEINSVNDIAVMGISRLMQVPNMGRKTISEISNAIFTAFTLGSSYCDTMVSDSHQYEGQKINDVCHPPFETSDFFKKEKKYSNPLVILNTQSFNESIQTAIGILKERPASVLRQRMGLYGPKKTLEEIATTFNLTRERIRQIELHSVHKIVLRMDIWEKKFAETLDDILEGRKTPLPLIGLPVLDPWFKGVETMEEPFKFALSNFDKFKKYSVINVDEQAYVSMLKQEEWNKIERSSREMVEMLSRKHPSPYEDEVRVLVESQLVRRGEELRPLLWEKVRCWAHFSEDSNGNKVLISFGMNAESLVEAVLSESPIPLHYSEIAKRCAKKKNGIDVRRVHNAAATVGYLFGQGIYGLYKHLGLSEEEEKKVLNEVEVMLSETPNRQWHATEIVEVLEEYGLDFNGKLSKYELNVLLKSSKNLNYLGRMVWKYKEHSHKQNDDRINIWQAVVSLIQSRGRPMFASEIKEILSRDRGVSSNFQIHQVDPIIRVGENEWGIIWRDIPLNESQVNEIVKEIISVLKERESGLHISEIIPSLKDNQELVSMLNPILLASLSIRTTKVKSAMGGYIYLAEWEGCRRLTVSKSIENAFDTFPDGAKTNDITLKASELLGRQLDNLRVSNVLSKFGFYDNQKGLWLHFGEVGEIHQEELNFSY